LPAPEDASNQPGRIHLGRRAADVRDRAGADVEREHGSARRALDGPGAADRRRGVRDRQGSERQGRGELPARRTEHHGRAALRRLRLHRRERPHRDGRRGQGSGDQRGRQGVLPRPRGRRPQELPRHQALPPPQALAELKPAARHAEPDKESSRGAEMNFHDTRETRDPEARERELLARLPGQVAHARAAAPALGRLLAGVDPDSVTSRAALAMLPVTRKSELLELQKAARPFGGFAAVGWGAACRRVFASPGPLYEPEGARPDYYRLARALFAAGFRAGDLVHNTFS